MGIIQFVDDERVIFVLPWQNRVVVGTTERANPVSARPAPTAGEVDQVLKELELVMQADKVRPRRALAADRPQP